MKRVFVVLIRKIKRYLRASKRVLIIIAVLVGIVVATVGLAALIGLLVSWAWTWGIADNFKLSWLPTHITWLQAFKLMLFLVIIGLVQIPTLVTQILKTITERSKEKLTKEIKEELAYQFWKDIQDIKDLLLRDPKK